MRNITKITAIFCISYNCYSQLPCQNSCPLDEIDNCASGNLDASGCNTLPGWDPDLCCVPDPNPAIPINSNKSWLFAIGGLMIGVALFADIYKRKNNL